MKLKTKLWALAQRARLAIFRVPEGGKVGLLGLWEAGEVLDMGDCYVAYIDVNGHKNCVSVRSPSRSTALQRRQLIIDSVMGVSQADAQARKPEPVQLIARTQGDKTVQEHQPN